MTYNAPQYALDHLASLKVGDKAVLLEPLRPEHAYAWGDGILAANPWILICDAYEEYFNPMGPEPLRYGKPLTLPNGVKVKVLSVKPVRCDDLKALPVRQRQSILDSTSWAGVDLRPRLLNFLVQFYPGAWERNDWFWVAEVEVTT